MFKTNSKVTKLSKSEYHSSNSTYHISKSKTLSSLGYFPKKSKDHPFALNAKQPTIKENNKNSLAKPFITSSKKDNIETSNKHKSYLNLSNSEKKPLTSRKSFRTQGHPNQFKSFSNRYNEMSSSSSLNGLNSTTISKAPFSSRLKYNNTNNLPILSKSIYTPIKRLSFPVCFSKTLYIDKKLKPSKFYYLIRPENGGNLIKKCFNIRTNWYEIPFDKKKMATLQHQHQQIKTSSLEMHKSKEELSMHSFNFRWQETIRNIDFSNLSRLPSHLQMVNHFEFHNSISNKTNLFINLLRYAEWNDINIFKYIPMTIIFNYDDPKFITRFESFLHLYNKIPELTTSISLLNSKKYIRDNFYRDYFPFPDRLGGRTPMCFPNTHYKGGNLWLVKAPDLNRGRCIKVVKSPKDLQYYIRCFHSGINKGYKNTEIGKTPMTEGDVYNLYKGTHVIVQKYIEQPMLYRGRKFDIRVWVLLTHKMEVYMFKEGHLKTCSVKFNLESSDAYVHLTNYSFQKHNQNFSKFEYGNEISFQDLQDYLDEEYEKSDKTKEQFDFYVTVIPKMKEIIEIVFKSVKYQINKYKRKYCFEIFGFDFMLDVNGFPFLIEVNSNPGLEESSPLIKMLIPRMIDDALRLTVDDIFENKFTYYKDDKAYTYDEFDHSIFEVTGYSNLINMWEYICSIQE